MTLTDEEYRRAIDLCERAVTAARSDDGGPTVAGTFLGELATLLAEPVDEKGRGSSYWRGVSDGRLDERAHVGELRRVAEDHPSPDGPDGFPLWACPDCGTRAVTDHVPFGAGLDVEALQQWQAAPRLDQLDQPPFAPELADAPLPTGESGAPAPLVVDQPVHDSTLPAELSRGPLPDFPSDGPDDEGTHYSGDGCQPPHPDPTRDFDR